MKRKEIERPRPASPTKGFAPTAPRAKPAARPWLEAPSEIDAVDLISIPPPPTRAESPDIDIDVDVDLEPPLPPVRRPPQATSNLFTDATPSSWEHLEQFGPTTQVLAAPRIADLSTDVRGADGHPWQAVFARATERLRGRVVLGATMGALLLGGIGAFAVVPTLFVRSAIAHTGGRAEASSVGESLHVASAASPARTGDDHGPARSAPSLAETGGIDAEHERMRDEPSQPSKPTRTAQAAISAGSPPTAVSHASRSKPGAPLIASRPSSVPAPTVEAQAPTAPSTPLSTPPARNLSPFSDVEIGAPFDRSAAMDALRSAGDGAKSCIVGESGARVAVTFARSGAVSDVTVEGPLAGTPKGNCLVAKFRGVRVPPFAGSSVTVRKTISF